MASNFRLDNTTFQSGGRMDENGKCTIVKRFLYNIIDNSKERRRNAVFELESLVPRKGSCMSDDARYVMKSAEWNCLDWSKQSVKFYINATYQRASDDDAASAPWNLQAFNISSDTVEEAIAFRMAYNNKNERVIPVLNTAGDPIEANTNEILPQFSFAYYVQNFDASKVYDFSNTVNATSQRILGKAYPAGTLLLADISADALVTYEDDGYTVKWKYHQVNVTFRYNPLGWKRKLLNVGNRARFGTNKKSELIYQFNEPTFSGSSVSFAESPTLSSAKTYYANANGYRQGVAALEESSGVPAQLPFEYAESIPLDKDGKIDNAAILGTTAYPTVEFNEYRTKSWRSLDIPSELKHKWR